ncbi:hypothetical protein ACFVAJ_18040 [Agromyces sp. NPDC057679]|uniref:hypothetical protein n=1 Tax=Agromyces sp. NPDC057679 TaxID=3346207 RepID=UPI00366BE30A
MSADGGWYTVIGLWVNDVPVVVGVIEGNHQVTGGDDVSEALYAAQGAWALAVEAGDATEAEGVAVDEMTDTLE